MVLTATPGGTGLSPVTSKVTVAPVHELWISSNNDGGPGAIYGYALNVNGSYPFQPGGVFDTVSTGSYTGYAIAVDNSGNLWVSTAPRRFTNTAQVSAAIHLRQRPRRLPADFSRSLDLQSMPRTRCGLPIKRLPTTTVKLSPITLEPVVTNAKCERHDPRHGAPNDGESASARRGAEQCVAGAIAAQCRPGSRPARAPKPSTCSHPVTDRRRSGHVSRRNHRPYEYRRNHRRSQWDGLAQ